jgi:hypothetical protein
MATTHPQRNNIFDPLAPDANRQVPSREHALDIAPCNRSLPDSQAETKLPINEVGLLHECLTEEHSNAETPVIRERPPVHLIKPTETRENDGGKTAKHRLDGNYFSAGRATGMKPKDFRLDCPCGESR